MSLEGAAAGSPSAASPTTTPSNSSTSSTSIEISSRRSCNQDSALLNQLKSQPSDPKAKDKIDAEVRDQREAYHQALLDLRKLVDSATEKYAELAKNDDVKKALAALGKGMREKPKLGPSHDF